MPDALALDNWSDRPAVRERGTRLSLALWGRLRSAPADRIYLYFFSSYSSLFSRKLDDFIFVNKFCICIDLTLQNRMQNEQTSTLEFLEIEFHLKWSTFTSRDKIQHYFGSRPTENTFLWLHIMIIFLSVTFYFVNFEISGTVVSYNNIFMKVFYLIL